jgi:hypothetical protein
MLSSRSNAPGGGGRFSGGVGLLAGGGLSSSDAPGGGSSSGVCALAQLMPSAARLARTSKTVAMFVIASARPLLAARGRGGSDSFNNTKAIGSDCKR